MTIRQKTVAITMAVSIFIMIIELVKKRKLREEYSWLWLMTGTIIIILSLWYNLLKWITALIGAILPTSTLFLSGLIFLMLISLHYSIKISNLTDQVKELTQQLAILKNEIESGGRG
ncbi:MAG: DUF2304 domain-containing protein [Nitrospirota bacterium]